MGERSASPEGIPGERAQSRLRRRRGPPGGPSRKTRTREDDRRFRGNDGSGHRSSRLPPVLCRDRRRVAALVAPTDLERTTLGTQQEDFASVRASVALAGAAGVTAVLIFGLMGFGVSDITNLTTETRDFSSRLTAMWGRSACGKPSRSWPWLERWRRGGCAPLVAGPDACRSRVGPVLPSAAVSRRSRIPLFPDHALCSSSCRCRRPAALGIVWVARISAGTSRRSAEDRAGLTPVAVSRVVAAADSSSCSVRSWPHPVSLRSGRLGGERVGGACPLVASYVATVVPDTPVVVLTSPAMEEVPDGGGEAGSGTSGHVPRASIASVRGRRGAQRSRWDDAQTGRSGGMKRSRSGASRAGSGSGPALRDRGAWSPRGPSTTPRSGTRSRTTPRGSSPLTSRC